MRENKELIISVICIVAAIAACFLFTYQQVTISEHRWCSALDTLTAQKVPYPSNPKANPSRLQAYTLYQEFVTIKGEFGC